MPKLDASEITTLDSLLRHFGIAPLDWDFLIVGDGSGTTWATPFGWGSVLVAKGSFKREAFYGGMCRGTNNMAELMAVLHPLMYLANNDFGVRENGCKVHVISDSQYVVEGLNKDNPIWISGLALNRELWMAIHMVRRKGIVLKGHHIPRDTIDLNKLGHDLANIARKRQEGVMEELPHDVYQANPEDEPIPGPSVET